MTSGSVGWDSAYIDGREAIFAGLKKSIDGLDRRCTDRQIDLTMGPDAIETDDGQEVIVAMRGEYDEGEMEGVGAWMLKYGEGLDGSYV